MRALMVCSSGGHLAQLLRLRPWWEQHERLWVTFDTPDAVSRLAGEDVVWAHHPTTRNVRNLVRNARQARHVLGGFGPDVVVTTGAAVAVPYFWLSRRHGAPTVYVEVFDRVDTRTLTARLCAPRTDLLLVQWAEQQELYPRSVLLGSLY